MAKKSKKIENKEIKSKKKSEKSKTTMWIFGIVGVIVLFLVLISLYSYYGNNFTYLNLKFSKVKAGQLIFYYAKIPLFNSNGELSNYYNLYIRNDPRTLEDIKINGTLRMMKKIIIASDDLKCEDAGIAGGELGGLIGLWSRVIVGTVNKTLAEETGKTYASCSMKEGLYIDSTVLVFKPGNVTEINQIGRDCYEVSVKDCDILRATERFILALYAHSKGLKI